ncbi:MAG: hypothetical protein ACYTX0_48830 [Nostoc sp.]
MGKKLPVWPMPYAPRIGAAIPLHRLKGIEFPAVFNEDMRASASRQHSNIKIVLLLTQFV